MEDNTRIGRTGIIAYAPLFLWIGVIFYLSSDQGSMTETSRFIRPLLEFLFPHAPDATLQAYHGYIRKAAHFSEYAILAILAARTCSYFLGELSHRSRYMLPLAIVLIVAVADEFNQSFLASRTGSVTDVALDLVGGISGAVTWLLWKRSAR